MVHRIKRPWLRYLTGNFLAATAVCLPLGMALIFFDSELGLPLWWAVLLTPAVVALDGWHATHKARGPWLRRMIKLGMGAAIGVALTLLEAPWRDAYTASSFWQHSLGMALGGALAGVWVCVANWTALRLEKRGPFTQLIPSGPLIMTLVAAPTGAIAGYIVSVFSLMLWTFTVADLGPSFLPVEVWITLVTAVVLAPLGWLMGFFSDIARDETSSGTSGGGLPRGGGGGGSIGGGGGGGWSGGSSSSSSYDDEE